MKVKKYIFGNEMEVIPNIAFRVMSFMIRVRQFFSRDSNRLENFNIKKGFTVIDYGCGPGGYVKKAAQLVGEEGKVYAVDIHPLAAKYVQKIIRENTLTNVTPVLVQGYSCSLSSNVADLIYILDTFHMIKDTDSFLQEICRLLKSSGVLVLDDGHQSRDKTKQKIAASGLWTVFEETEGYLKCRPVH